MKDNLYVDNKLEPIVDEFELHKKSNFRKFDHAEIDDFPQLDKKTIKSNISLGS